MISSPHVLAQRTCRTCYFCIFANLALFICFVFSGQAVPVATNASTIVADSTCLQDMLQPNTNKTYEVLLDGCLHGVQTSVAFLHLEIWDVETNDANGLWTVDGTTFVNVGSGAPIPGFQENGVSNKNTMGDRNASASLTIAINHYDQNRSWFATVASTSSQTRFLLKAWCSDRKTCVQNCTSPDGLCVARKACRCVRLMANTSCDPEVQPIPTHEDEIAGGALSYYSEEVIEPGDWRYYSFEVPHGQGRFLVEILRSRGDVALFVKPGNGGNNLTILPSEYDLNGYADKLSYVSRLSHHHLNGTGTGLFYVGVLNSRTCVQEASGVKLAIRAVSVSSTVALCPLNCSYPYGVCIQDGTCQCKSFYGGVFCESSFQTVKPHRKISGTIGPGQSQYLRLKESDLGDRRKVSVSFSGSGGHPVLVAQRGRFPTLTDYHLKSMGTAAGKTVLTEEYEVDRTSMPDGDLIFAVFNLDFIIHEEAMFELLVGLYTGQRNKALTPWLILLVAVSSSIILCVSVGIFKNIRSRRRPQENVRQDEIGEPNLLNIEGEDLAWRQHQGLGKAVVQGFPLLVYQQGLLGEDETQCPICLNEYVAAEVLCAVPLCTHIFHLLCMEKWLQLKCRCPLCRISLEHIRAPGTVNSGQGSNSRSWEAGAQFTGVFGSA